MRVGLVLGCALTLGVLIVFATELDIDQVETTSGVQRTTVPQTDEEQEQHPHGVDRRLFSRGSGPQKSKSTQRTKESKIKAAAAKRKGDAKKARNERSAKCCQKSGKAQIKPHRSKKAVSRIAPFAGQGSISAKSIAKRKRWSKDLFQGAAQKAGRGGSRRLSLQ